MATKNLRILSWNVNGIRAIIKKEFLTIIKTEDPDILCLQETKAHQDQVDKILDDFPYHHWNTAKKKGYSGTAIFSKVKPLSITYDMGIEEHDQEGRVICLEFDHYYLITVYTPNAQHELARLPYRVRWEKEFLDYMKRLEKKKPFIFCRDLNVAHQEIDLARPADNHDSPGFSDEERQGFTNIVNAGFIDTFRYLHPENVQYTWWSYRTNARARNVGWRIDYFCISKSLLSRLKKAWILDHAMGSDHCPVGIELGEP